jgi:hypothetical protein
VVGSGQEQRPAVSVGGDPVAVAVWDAFDEAVVAQASQVVGALSAGDRARLAPEQGFEVVAEVSVGEPAW